MQQNKTINDLQKLIQNEIEESTVLEYKGSFAKQNPKWKEELAKDISALANSNGGTIIFGIREKESEGEILYLKNCSLYQIQKCQKTNYLNFYHQIFSQKLKGWKSHIYHMTKKVVFMLFLYLAAILHIKIGFHMFIIKGEMPQ